MKRKSQILVMLLVSMLIAYVGAGTLVAQCRHTGQVEAVDAHSSCDSCCPKPRKDCMTLTVKTLTPAVSQQQICVDSPSLSVLPAAMVSDFSWSPEPAEIRPTVLAGATVHSPPRCYLNFIQVLLI